VHHVLRLLLDQADALQDVRDVVDAALLHVQRLRRLQKVGVGFIMGFRTAQGDQSGRILSQILGLFYPRYKL
jgi:hypothetical protein